jgi:ATP-binding cassette subfamily B protein
MKSLLALIPYFKKYKTKLLLGLIFIICSIALLAIYPLIIGDAIDELTQGTHHHSMIYYAIWGVSLVLLGGLFLFFTRQTIIVVSREIENDLRHDFFAHLQTLSKNYYDKISTGDLMAHATNDINSVRDFLGPGIMYTSQTLVRTVITLFILFSINVEMTLIALLPLPLISIFVYFVVKVTYKRSLKVQEAFSDLTTNVQENFSGIRVIKSYVREDHEQTKFNGISKDLQEKNLSLARLQAISFPMMFLFTGISMIIVIYFGGLKVIDGTLTMGNITEYLIYLVQLTWPMIALGWVVNLIQRAAPSMQRLMKIINTKPNIADNNLTDSSITKDKIEGEIEFKNVSFKYPGTNIFVLKNINLKIRKGTTLGIIGHTGVGKSSFINLIPRIYDVTDGNIFIDGYNIKNIPLRNLRESIGIVPQESFLFSETIGRNIAYSSNTIDNEKMIISSKRAGLYKDTETFPEKFKTILGERGITLSGGQKQRTSLSRAIYMRPKILILDDSLSAVDTHTEEEILKELKEVMKDRTSIIISHRISTIKNANNIIVLSNSQIKEEGTHNELISLGGIYYDIHIKQLLEEEIEKLD